MREKILVREVYSLYRNQFRMLDRGYWEGEFLRYDRIDRFFKEFMLVEYSFVESFYSFIKGVGRDD